MSPRALLLCTDPGVPLDAPSGASAHLRGVGRALTALGYDVTAAVARRVDARGEVPDRWEGRVIEGGARRRQGWGRLREVVEAGDGARLRAAARRQGPWDLVWERFALGGAGGASLGRRHVLEVNAPIGRERGIELRWRGWVRVVERRTLRGAGEVVCVSPWLLRWAHGHGIAARRIPQGTELPPGDRARGRAILELPEDGRTLVGWHGHPRPWHGLDRLDALASAMPDAVFVAIGAEPDGAEPSGPVHRYGPRYGRDLADVLSALDVAIVPHGARRPWLAPLKIADAQGQGVPVVSSETEGAVAMLGPHDRSVAPGAPVEAWASAIREAAAGPRTDRRRTWEDVVRQVLDDGDGGGPIPVG